MSGREEGLIICILGRPREDERRENEVPKEGSAKRPGRWKETTRVFGRREQVMKKKASRRWHRRSGPGIRSKSYSSERETR